MRNTRITLKLIMGLKPCPDWPEERVAEFIKDGMSFREFLVAPGLTDAERLWLAFHDDFITPSVIREVLGMTNDAKAQKTLDWPDKRGALAFARSNMPDAALMEAVLRYVEGVK